MASGIPPGFATPLTSLIPALERGLTLLEAFMTIDENFRPVKVNQFRRALSKDREFRRFYTCHPYSQLIVLADKFPCADLLAFARRNHL